LFFELHNKKKATHNYVELLPYYNHTTFGLDFRKKAHIMFRCKVFDAERLKQGISEKGIITCNYYKYLIALCFNDSKIELSCSRMEGLTGIFG